MAVLGQSMRLSSPLPVEALERTSVDLRVHGDVRSDDALLIALAPKTISRELRAVLSTLTAKAKSGDVSPKGFVDVLRYLRDVERKPAETFGSLISTLRRAQPFGPLILDDPNSPAARALATAAGLLALQRFEKGALANQSIVDAGLRILSFADAHGLLEAGVSREKIRATLQPPLREALADYLKRYGSDPAINKLLQAGGQRGEPRGNPPRTALQVLLGHTR